MGFPGSSVGKESVCKAGDKRSRFDPWVRKIPWRRAWQPTPVFLPGESYGQRRLGLQTIGSQRVRHDWNNWPQTHTSNPIMRASWPNYIHKAPSLKISSHAMCMLSCFSRIRPFATHWTAVGSSVHGILQARILEWVASALLQGTFPTQGLNPCLCLLHWK